MRLSTLAALLFPVSLLAQTVLYEEDFGTDVSDWTLNTTDLGSVVSGDNSWVINPSYNGGSGTLVCLGFPFTFTVPNTPNQPATLDPNPNSHYLHITSTAAAASGITCCTFQAADGFCEFDASHFASMNTDISTLGSDNISLDFWWLCAGSFSNFGEVYYSLDSGGSWTQITSPDVVYFNQSTWTQTALEVPELANQPSVRFGFRFVNNTNILASDPAFGIDEFKVIAVAAADIAGCTDVNAYNYDPEATVDSGCCFYLDVESLCGPGTHWDADLGYCVITCQADFNYDGTIGTPDLLDFLGEFGTDCP
ncbi:MAG: hypothetical protein ACON34_05910 [Flavobacteriales bacterium]